MVTWLLLLACTGDDADAWSSGVAVQDATNTWNELRGYQMYFGQTDPWVGIQPNSSHHDDETHARIWVSPRAEGRVGSTLPNHSILVLEAFRDPAAPPSWIGVMRKVPGYTAEFDDWFWAAYTPTGGVLEAGAVEACAGCHVSGADYVRSANRDPAGSGEDTGDTGS